ncbi:hypothetical protein RRG08_066737, partial [Elysia crispata]
AQSHEICLHSCHSGPVTRTVSPQPSQWPSHTDCVSTAVTVAQSHGICSKLNQ